MRIALFLESVSESGGGFQQALTTIHEISRAQDGRNEVIAVSLTAAGRESLKAHGIEAEHFKDGIAAKLIDAACAGHLAGLARARINRLGWRRLGRSLDGFLDDRRIDLVLFNEPSELAMRVGDHPFITTVWDLGHRENLEFPEVSAQRQFEARERVYRATLPRAVGVIVNCAALARRIERLYDVDPRRIIEIPFLPSLPVRRQLAGGGTQTAAAVAAKYRLREPFVFYPAQFWPHKNHLYLLEGLAALERRHGIVVHVVFCGSDKGNRATVERQAEALGLAARMHILGYVPDDDIPALYQAAVALVMPTFIGPTNLPPLEAAALGCPVIYSDLPDFREQMGDAALYCDLDRPAALADHLAALLRDPQIAAGLRAAGAALAARVMAISYGERLGPVLDRFSELRRRWASPDGR